MIDIILKLFLIQNVYWWINFKIISKDLPVISFFGNKNGAFFDLFICCLKLINWVYCNLSQCSSFLLLLLLPLPLSVPLPHTGVFSNSDRRRFFHVSLSYLPPNLVKFLLQLDVRYHYFHFWKGASVPTHISTMHIYMHESMHTYGKLALELKFNRESLEIGC